jgi:hypothetical protein
MLGDNLCLTVLTGRRLDLLRRTLSALDQADLQILRGSVVIVYLNGHDPETAKVVRGLPYVDRFEYRDTSTPEPIGNAVSRLANWVPKRCRYHMHLEDDWTCKAKNSQFLADASMVLELEPKVGQVRMRLTSESVMKHNMITHSAAPWKDRKAHGLEYQVSALHYTFNPALGRVADLGKIYPADHERTAAKNYMRHFPLVAQIPPGCFKHIGDEGKSLRAKLGRS